MELKKMLEILKCEGYSKEIVYNEFGKRKK
ncbi:hypothetical protein L323_06970 [Ruminiclostridium papyrosolvens C7]|uniref:Uncharacterized protein n=1 Tax=Ruminiclostridium papyrosolvens C7 TaxID=1330534 RepID=U4R326_9FIRM|nr:hypothetical protein L323_06970 [Ruminiclostridium papyrosolvens C7]